MYQEGIPLVENLEHSLMSSGEGLSQGATYTSPAP